MDSFRCESEASEYIDYILSEKSTKEDKLEDEVIFCTGGLELFGQGYFVSRKSFRTSKPNSVMISDVTWANYPKVLKRKKLSEKFQSPCKLEVRKFQFRKRAKKALAQMTSGPRPTCRYQV